MEPQIILSMEIIPFHSFNSFVCKSCYLYVNFLLVYV